VRRGLARSREQAQADITSGRVLVGGAPAVKPSHLVAAAEPVEVLGPPSRFVGRGGHKLDGALTRFAVDVDGRRCLDAGASTGGFTDCLLQRGAAEVVAVDVGYGQLHERLRDDPRVANLERTNARTLTRTATGGPVSVVAADLSFISLRTVLPALLSLAEPEADLVLLVKPQFEAGRRDASRGRGVVRDPAVWRRVLEEVGAAVINGGATRMSAMVSPLTGADGNVEFFLHARNAPPGPDAADAVDTDLDALVAEALTSVGA
jgi:23S rRNA (cytidine1920-2'-O)/16S rRNA (cytidine1409-2'-O)-methyltransferase